MPAFDADIDLESVSKVTNSPNASAGGDLVPLSQVNSLIAAAVANLLSSTTLTNQEQITQAAYDALTPPDANTVYLIVG